MQHKLFDSNNLLLAGATSKRGDVHKNIAQTSCHDTYG